MTILDLEPRARRGPDRAERLSFDDLEQFIHVSFGPDPDMQSVTTGTHRLCTDNFIARICGLNRQSVFRYRREGVPLWSADRLAVHMGTHPIHIWRDFHASV